MSRSLLALDDEDEESGGAYLDGFRPDLEGSADDTWSGRLRSRVGRILESSLFWVCVVLLVLFDLCIFGWQVGAAARPASAPPRPPQG